VTRRARGDGGLPRDEQRDPNGTGDAGGGHPNDRRVAVRAANKRRNRMTPEALRRVAEIAQAHRKSEGARSDALVSDDAYHAIEDALDVSPRTAQRWVKWALEAGLL
jgi:hypothetical protein